MASPQRDSARHAKSRFEVLVIDDDPYYRNVCSALLSNAGFQHKSPRIPDEVTWAEIASADLVLLDMIMPGRDGMDLLQEMAARQIKTDIVLVTALKLYEMPEVLDAIAELGLRITGLVYKPFVASMLLAEIEKSFERPGSCNYDRFSLDMLQDAIATDDFVMNYRPYFALGTSNIVYVHAEPHLVGTDGAVGEPDYCSIVGSSRLALSYFKYIVNKVAIETAYIPEFQNQSFVVKVSPVLLATVATTQQIKQILEPWRQSGLRFVLALDDQEYFFQAQDFGRPIRDLKSLGYGFLLQDASYSFSEERLAELLIFDFVNVSCSKANSGVAPDADEHAHVALATRLAKRGLRCAITIQQSRIPQWLLGQSGFSICNRMGQVQDPRTADVLVTGVAVEKQAVRHD